MPKTRIHMCAEGVLVRRLDNTVVFLTNDNIKMMSRTSTPRPGPGPPLKPVISKALVRQPSVNPNPSVNLKPLVSQPSLVRQPSLNHLTTLGPPVAKDPYYTGPPPGTAPVKNPYHTGPPLVRQPSLKPPSPKVPKKKLAVGEKRNISKQELKIILNSLKEIRTKIRTIDRTPDELLSLEDGMNHRVYKKQLQKLNAKLC